MHLLLVAVLFSVRPVDPIAANTLDLALTRSAVARSLIDRLEQSNVVVHIQSSRELPAGIGGTTRFVVSRGDHRYLRITIDARLPKDARIAILAHELTHACEIAESPASDTRALEQLFEHVGKRSGAYFETASAVATERLVRMELDSRRVLQAEPVVKFHH